MSVFANLQFGERCVYFAYQESREVSQQKLGDACSLYVGHKVGFILPFLGHDTNFIFSSVRVNLLLKQLILELKTLNLGDLYPDGCC